MYYSVPSASVQLTDPTHTDCRCAYDPEHSLSPDSVETLRHGCAHTPPHKQLKRLSMPQLGLSIPVGVCVCVCNTRQSWKQL